MASLISKSLSTMSDESRSLGVADTNVFESQNRRGNVLIRTHSRPGEAARKLEDVDKLDVNSLREGQFNNVVLPCGFRWRGTSNLQPSGVGASNCGKRRRTKIEIGPMQKRARKWKHVTTMDNAMTRDESSGSVSNSAKGGDSSEGLETTGVDRIATASAHIDEMRVSAAAEEIQLSNRIEHEVSELLERASAGAYKHQSPGLSSTYHRNIAARVRLNLSTFPLVCGWYVVVKMLCTSSMLHTRRKQCATNCDPLSESSVTGAPYLNTQCSTNATATSYAAMRFRGTTFVSFVQRSEITSINMKPRELFGNGPKMSMATESSGAVAGKSFISLAFLRRRSRFLAHGVHSRTVALMLAAICGQ